MLWGDHRSTDEGGCRGQQPKSWPSLRGLRRLRFRYLSILRFEFLQFAMPQYDLDAVPFLQPFRNLFGQVHRAMLPARASERNHEVLESPSLIIAHTGTHQRHHAGQKLVHALLLVEIVDHRRVHPSKHLESLLPTGVRQTAPIKNKSPAIPPL